MADELDEGTPKKLSHGASGSYDVDEGEEGEKEEDTRGEKNLRRERGVVSDGGGSFFEEWFCVVKVWRGGGVCRVVVNVWRSGGLCGVVVGCVEWW